MDYTASEIADILKVPAPVCPSLPVSELLIDSRSLTYPAASLFFAVETPQNDGHRYVAPLYTKGVRNFVVTRIPEEMKAVTDANFFVVPDVVEALQAIAASHRSRFNLPVIAITGSRGKTTVKEWLYRLLQDDMNIVRSPRSYNSQIGVPLSLWALDDSARLGIFETGISMPGEMEKLEHMVRPCIGLLTNITMEHSGGFGSMREKCEEKVKMLRGCKTVIYNGDDPLIADVANHAGLLGKKLFWSRRNPDAPLYIKEISKTGTNSEITYSYLGAPMNRFTVPFVAGTDIENVISCLAVMLLLDCGADVIASRMNLLTPVGTRLEVIEGVNRCMIVHDSYTSDFASLSPALDFMSRRTDSATTETVILSDLMHEKRDPDEIYAEMALLLRLKGVKRVIGIGPEISRHSGEFGPGSQFFVSTDDFLRSMSSADFAGELILVKGAPGFEFSRICEMLEARQHETVLEINLDAIVHNFNVFRSHIRPDTGIVCMVKASGYGAGAFELAKTLQAQGATYLAVAVHDEGADLRKAGIAMPIIVLNPRVENFESLFANRLEPEIYSLDFLNHLISEARKRGIRNYPVHIKIDSGMHRLGFRLEEIDRVAEVLNSQDCVVPRSIFSHLCAADDPSEDEYTLGQFEYFDRCCDRLQAAIPGKKILRHILNSTGITRFPAHQHDMVRLGIGLYGIRTMHDGSQDDLRPVSSLHTIINNIRRWEAGTTIGYNRRGRLTRDSVIATIPVGYADGLNRHLGYGNACVAVKGHRCPIVGSICMDACMIDVTDVPGGVSLGDRVEIFGDTISVEELADILGTIPYEVLTSVSTRVKRVYYRE